MRPKSCTTRFLFTGIAVALFAVGATAHAATLTLDPAQQVLTQVTTPVNLTSGGGIDWAYWAPTTGNVVSSPVAPTNEKVGGVAIGGLENIGGTGLRGSSSATTVEKYSWSDGTSVSAPTGTNQGLAGLIFNSNIGSSGLNTGLQLSIAGDPAVERIVKLYIGGYGATGTLTLTLNGVDAPTNPDQVFTFTNGSPKQMLIYTVHFRPDSVSDQLLVQYTASAISDTANGHVGFQAVTIAAVPEPGVASLACLAGLAFCGRRRRS